MKPRRPPPTLVDSAAGLPAHWKNPAAFGATAIDASSNLHSPASDPASAMVSVVIPCHNYARFLPATLESVRAQTHQNWECLVVDDGSSDGSLKVARDYAARDNRIRALSQPNSGVSAARNTGLAAARGDWLQFLDADDLLAPGRWATLLASGPLLGSTILVGDFGFFQGEDIGHLEDRMAGQDNTWLERNATGPEAIDRLLAGNFMAINAPLLPMPLIRAVGNFDIALRGNEDWDYWLRCALQGAAFARQRRPGEPETWALVRVHASSATKTGDTMLASQLILRDKWDALLAARPELAAARRLNATLMERENWGLALFHLERGGWAKAWRTCFCFARRHPGARSLARLLLAPALLIAARARQRRRPAP